MRARVWAVLILALVVAAFACAAAVTGSELPPSHEAPAIPALTDRTASLHTPYDPFQHPEALPQYPPQPRPARSPLQVPLARPAGVDLDVTHISRAPLYTRYDVWYTSDGKPYLRPGTENDPRWPGHGQVVTFTAHVMNKGTTASGPFGFRWFIDDVEVESGTHPGLAPAEEATATCPWTWDHTVQDERLLEQHRVRFSVDPGGAVDETYESNNSLEDRTDALSLVLAVTPELYEALETPVDPKWPFSAEDWLQKQIAAMNQAFASSTYPSAPGGIEERVRLDSIQVTAVQPPVDRSRDGGFYMTADDRFGNPYYDPIADVSGALIHELTHQLGIIDIYTLDAALEIPQVLDRNGRPVQMELWAVLLQRGLMGNPGIRPRFYSEHTALALNANKGYRRGYYGEYLYDVPAQTSLRVLDSRGDPAEGVTVALYQRASSPNMLGSRHGVIDNSPEISVETGTAGLALLPNRPAGIPVSTHTGHSLVDNPLGVINVTGTNDEFLVELCKGTHQEFLWLDITRFNLAARRGETTLDVPSHVPPDGAPAPPASLGGTQEAGQVNLRWQPSPSPGISGSNLYRTTGPAAAWTRIVTGTSSLDLDLAYDYSVRAAGYAVTAVDSAGGESGFSDLFWALRLDHPAAIALDEQDRRVVLDPQGGYSLLLQSPAGTYLDTLGSFDLHLEYSQYLARDPGGRLIVSHPGDHYSSRHSVRVTDDEANLLFEFGQRGSEAGQFETPAGVALWGEPCTYGGPYATDAHTLLLLHLDRSYDGEQGEHGTPNGTTFDAGRFGQGARIDATDTLTYTTAGNLRRDQGAVEFWLQPSWDGDDGQSHTVFEVGDGWLNRLRIMKDGANNLRFLLWDAQAEYGVGYNVAHWQAGSWYHVAATWAGSDMALFVDGQERASRHDANPPGRLAAAIYLGSSYQADQQAGAVLDEFRISDLPRVGNSDTCLQRILVADRGNHRIQAFHSDGGFVSSYGSLGDGPGLFNDPAGLDVDRSGRILVADSGNDRLQVLSFNGTSFGYLHSISADLEAPIGVDAYGDSRILVADTGHHKVKVLDGDGNILVEHTAPNDGHSGPFDSPRGVLGVCASGDIVVADTGNRRVATIAGVLPPLADFDASPTAGVAPLTVDFTDTTCGQDYDRLWVLGDGVTSTLPGPTHTYLLPGVYTVSLTASGPGGSDTVTRTRYIRVGAEHSIYLPLVLKGVAPPPILDCEEQIENGGFEDGTAWLVGATPRPARYTTERAHGGDRSLLLGLRPGEADVHSYSSVRQTVHIPSGIYSATLTFWAYPLSDLDDGDFQECLLLDEQDQPLAILMRTNLNTSAWTRASYDLSAYAGQTVKVYFNARNDGDGAGVVGFFLDDVSLQACTSAGPPPPLPTALPTPGPGDCYPTQLTAEGVGDGPHGLAVHRAANRIYVANHHDDTLSVLDGQTFGLVTTVSAGDGPNGVAYNPANDLIYVADRNANTVTVLRAEDYGLLKAIGVGTHPNGLAVNVAANRVYVANFGSGTVSVIDGASHLVSQTVPVGGEPSMIAVNPATGKAYVSLHGEGKVAVIDGAGNAVQVDIASNGPYGIALDKERNLVYVTTIDAARIAVIDGSSDTFLGWAEIRRSPGEEPVPLRMVAVNPLIGTSGHLFLTTTGEDGGWNQILLVPKGWDEGFARPYALALNEPREGIAFDPTTLQLMATSRSDDLLAVYLDGEPVCPSNLITAAEYQVTVCVADAQGGCLRRFSH
jgi:YVTN family beta-propeller protein